VIDIIGTSTTSCEEAAADAINTAGQSVRDLRGAEVVKQNIHVGDGSELIYRTKIQPSSTSRNRRRVRRASSLGLGLLGSHHRKH
jgi:flavin-binding protein dodecin